MSLEDSKDSDIRRNKGGPVREPLAPRFDDSSFTSDIEKEQWKRTREGMMGRDYPIGAPMTDEEYKKAIETADKELKEFRKGRPTAFQQRMATEERERKEMAEREKKAIEYHDKKLKLQEEAEKKRMDAIIASVDQQLEQLEKEDKAIEKVIKAKGGHLVTVGDKEFILTPDGEIQPKK